MRFKIYTLLFGTLLMIGAGCSRAGFMDVLASATDKMVSVGAGVTTLVTPVPRFDFSSLMGKGMDEPLYRFSAQLPEGWTAEFVPQTEAVTIYPREGEGSPLERAQIFIRYFKSSQFLTLSTVDIVERQPTQLGNHAAVRYVIEKKSNVPDFNNQPGWRNERHTVVDVRFSTGQPSLFYVFAKSPELPPEDFEAFLDSLVLHNDQAAWVAPLSRSAERITKKPFGLHVTRQNSPVQPERFDGYHTGTDFEILDEQERVGDMPVAAVCGGLIRAARTASGYGGVVVQQCLLDDQEIIVVYGHLDMGSVGVSVGQYVSPGVILGNLGADKSAQTDGERKHLHLGWHRGSALELAGYVGAPGQLDQWFDPCRRVCR